MRAAASFFDDHVAFHSSSTQAKPWIEPSKAQATSVLPSSATATEDTVDLRSLERRHGLQSQGVAVRGRPVDLDLAAAPTADHNAPGHVDGRDAAAVVGTVEL